MSLDQKLALAVVTALVLFAGAVQFKNWWDDRGGPSGFA